MASLLVQRRLDAEMGEAPVKCPFVIHRAGARGEDFKGQPRSALDVSEPQRGSARIECARHIQTARIVAISSRGPTKVDGVSKTQPQFGRICRDNKLLQRPRAVRAGEAIANEENLIELR